MRGWNWILGFVGGGVVLSFLAYASFAEKIDTPWAIAGAVGAVLIGLWLYLDRESLLQSASARGARYTWTAILITVLAVGLTFAVNVLGKRYDKRWDITSSQSHSLSAQTVSVLKGLDRAVTVDAFFTLQSQPEEETLRTLLEGYQQYTTQLTVNWHDPMNDPVIARQFEITSEYGTVVLSSGDDKQRLESQFDEEALTNALIRLASGREHIVCFTEGHDEMNPDDDNGPEGLGAAIVKLEGQNYTVKKVNLLSSPTVPADCEMLISAAPQQDWAPAEREVAAAYVAGGGSFVLLAQPGVADGLAADMARYGIVVGKDVVLEQNPKYQLMGGDISYVILDPTSFDHHKLTDPITNMVLLRLARSVDKGPDLAGINVQVLAHTSDQAWAETTLDAATPPAPDEKDRIGQIPLMAVAEITDPNAIKVGSRVMSVGDSAGFDAIFGGAPPSDVSSPTGAAAATPTAATPTAATPAADETAITRKPGGRVIVIGDADFAGNELLDQFMNKDLFQNIVAWLAGEDNQVSIRATKAGEGSLNMSLIQGLLVGITALLVAPGVAVGMAIGTWRRRRSL